MKPEISRPALRSDADEAKLADYSKKMLGEVFSGAAKQTAAQFAFKTEHNRLRGKEAPVVPKPAGAYHAEPVDLEDVAEQRAAVRNGLAQSQADIKSQFAKFAEFTKMREATEHKSLGAALKMPVAAKDLPASRPLGSPEDVKKQLKAAKDMAKNAADAALKTKKTMEFMQSVRDKVRFWFQLAGLLLFCLTPSTTPLPISPVVLFNCFLFVCWHGQALGLPAWEINQRAAAAEEKKLKKQTEEAAVKLRLKEDFLKKQAHDKIFHPSVKKPAVAVRLV